MNLLTVSRVLSCESSRSFFIFIDLGVSDPVVYRCRWVHCGLVRGGSCGLV